ncbi:TrmH family RNA methyltransferase [Maribacter sp. 2307ULW6-5]|uniref:TrmH family RNA methyltransferase n=1 Tax=Maribacter sp. 2307ULW6-5 TaxID=3386275 RepID=UPI0039BC8A80
MKLIRSLGQKKYRLEHGLFVVEGQKAISEFLGRRHKVHKIYVTDAFASDFGAYPVVPVTPRQLGQMSQLKNPSGALAVFGIPAPEPFLPTGWCLALDGVQDPGNLGTIIRLCDWFQIDRLLCSPNTVDCYNPKVLQATMGSLARVKVHYGPLPTFFEAWDGPVYGAFMDGAAAQRTEFGAKGMLLMGNEGQGISKEMAKWCTARVGVPQFGPPTAESLNVATATAILLHEVRRGH